MSLPSWDAGHHAQHATATLLRYALHEQGVSLQGADADASSPAHLAAGNGHESCLRVLHELGAAASLSEVNANGSTPAHLAATSGHESCLRVLHELGAAASLSAAEEGGWTLAHLAA